MLMPKDPNATVIMVSSASVSPTIFCCVNQLFLWENIESNHLAACNWYWHCSFSLILVENVLREIWRLQGRWDIHRLCIKALNCESCDHVRDLFQLVMQFKGLAWLFLGVPTTSSLLYKDVRYLLTFSWSSLPFLVLDYHVLNILRNAFYS